MTTVRRTLIFDKSIDDWDSQGPPICFNNQDIRKMLELAHAGKEDVFYDLGSGWGQNLIIALTEYDVKKAIGVEADRERYEVSVKRLRRWKIAKERWAVVPQRFEKVLAGKVPQANLGEATIVFYGLTTDSSTLNDIARNLSPRGRLVYYYKCLFPEIMPVDDDFPFFLSVAPFKRPSSELEWLQALIRKKRSSISPRRKPDVSELWLELRRDYDVESAGNPIREYRARLRKSIATRERIFHAPR